MTFMTESLDFFGGLIRKRRMLLQLAVRDFQNRYIGSTLGFIWTVIQPLVMVIILWFLFGVIWKNGPVRGAPFIAYLLVGMGAWSFFAEALGISTPVFQEYSFLVKKMNFQIALLPIVKLLSSLLVHGIFLAIAIVILLATGTLPSFYWLQTFYYMGALMALLLGLSWMLSSFNVFLRDTAFIVNVFLQFGFWLTPVFWTVEQIQQPALQFCMRLNPMFYILEGYRESLLYHIPFWQHPEQTAYFWGFTLAALGLGALIFRKLKSHFADVL